MKEKFMAFLALGFWVFLAADFVLRVLGVWAGDPLVPLLGCIFILISSAILAQILEVRKQVDIVKYGTMYNISVQGVDYADLEKSLKYAKQNPDLN